MGADDAVAIVDMHLGSILVSSRLRYPLDYILGGIGYPNHEQHSSELFRNIPSFVAVGIELLGSMVYGFFFF